MDTILTDIAKFLQQNLIGLLTGGAALLGAYGVYREGQRTSKRLDLAEKRADRVDIESQHQADIDRASSIKKADLEVINIAIASLKEDNVRLTKRLSDSEARGDKLQARISELEQCIDKAETDLSTAQGTIRVLTAQVTEWQEKYTVLNTTWEQKYSTLEKNFQALKSAGSRAARQ
jgi:chromosome segregation ATPase